MNLKKLREEFAKLHQEATNAVETSKDAMTPDEKETFRKAQDARFARMNEIKETIDEAKKLAGVRLADGDDETFQPKDTPIKGGEFDAKKALNEFARRGVIHTEFTIDSTSGSGVLIPDQVMPPVVIRKNFNVIRAALAAKGLSPITSTATVNISIPTFDDDSQVAATQSESATSQTVAEPTTSYIDLTPALLTSKGIWMSNTALLAPGFDAMGYLLPLLTKRVDLAQEKAAIDKLIADGSIVGKTTASASAITYAELLDWEHSLKVAYRSDAVFIVSDSLLKLLRGLVDDNHRPLIELDPQTQVSTIHGMPIFVSDNFEAVGAGKVVGCIASVEALKIYDAGSPRLNRYAMVPSRPDQVGFELFANGDFGYVAKGVKTLKMAAS